MHVTYITSEKNNDLDKDSSFYLQLYA